MNMKSLSNNKQITTAFQCIEDQELPKQWESVSNRLTLVEENIMKLNKKVLKLQKNTIINFQGQKDLQKEFKQKLSEMVLILTQLPSQSSKFQSVQEQLTTLRIQISQIKQFKQWSYQQIKKLSQFNNSQVNFAQLQQFVKNQTQCLQQKVNYFVETKIKQVGFTIKQLKQSQDIMKTAINRLNNSQNMQGSSGNVLNTSIQSKYSSNSKISPMEMSHSKSSSKVLMNNIFQSCHPTHEICLSPKQSENSSNNLISTSSRYNNANQYNNYQNAKQANHNSRAVYLKQKLKEFQLINKRYEMKESQTPNKRNDKTQMLSTKKQQERHDPNHQRFVQRQKVKQQEILKSRQKERNTNSNSNNNSNYVQPNIQKRLQGIRISMEKTSNVSKMKNIKNYLEQTESQIDQSNIMEPYYK